MKKFYYAAFMPAEEGGFDIVIPDVPNCFTCADSMEEGFIMAEDVLALMLRDLAQENKSIPEPSALEQVKELTAKHLAKIDHAPTGEIHYQLIPAASLDLTPVKITISLPKSVLDEIDTKARRSGYTRSGYLARAALAYQAPAD